MAKVGKNDTKRCSKQGCSDRVEGKDHYQCTKHTYQRYHDVWFRGRQPVSVGDDRTLGDIL